MRPPHRILHRNHVHRLVTEHLQHHLQFKDYKRKTSAQVLWSLLLAAAARITSLSDACQRLENSPSDETARQALLATLPDYAALRRQLNATLAEHLPKTLRTHLQRLAIDLTLSLTTADRSVTFTRSTGVRPRTAPAISTPTPPLTSSATGNAIPSP